MVPTACSQCPAGFACANGACTGTRAWRTLATSSPTHSACLLIACPVSTFSSAAGSTTCTACPAGAFTVGTNATGIEQCLCLAGFSGVNGAACTGTCVTFDGRRPCVRGQTDRAATIPMHPACPINSYKPTVGSGACTQCTDNSFTNSVGTVNASQCLCSPGYYGSGTLGCQSTHTEKKGGGGGGVGATNIAYGSRARILAHKGCPSCDLTAFCPATGLTGCICQAGFTGSDNSACTRTCDCTSTPRGRS
jgi:hypothetical protein